MRLWSALLVFLALLTLTAAAPQDLLESVTSTTSKDDGGGGLTRKAKFRKLFSEIRMIEHPKANSQNVQGSVNQKDTTMADSKRWEPVDLLLAKYKPGTPKAKAPLAKTLTLPEAIHKLKPVFDRMPLYKLKLLKDFSIPGKEEEFEGVFGELYDEGDEVTALMLYENLKRHSGIVSAMLEGAILKKSGDTTGTSNGISASSENRYDQLLESELLVSHGQGPDTAPEDNFISSDKDKQEDWRGVEEEHFISSNEYEKEGWADDKDVQDNPVEYTAFTDNSYTNYDYPNKESTSAYFGYEEFAYTRDWEPPVVRPEPGVIHSSPGLRRWFGIWCFLIISLLIVGIVEMVHSYVYGGNQKKTCESREEENLPPSDDHVTIPIIKLPLIK